MTKWLAVLSAVPPISPAPSQGRPILTSEGVTLSWPVFALLVAAVGSGVSLGIHLHSRVQAVEQWRASRPTNADMVRILEQLKQHDEVIAQGGRWTKEDALRVDGEQNSRATQMAKNFAERLEGLEARFLQIETEHAADRAILLGQDNELYGNQERNEDAIESLVEDVGRRLGRLERFYFNESATE